MKKAVAYLLALLLLSGLFSSPFAQNEAGCPADRIARKGFTIFEKLHHVMAPAWHDAYPGQDYEALGEAIEKFADMIPDLKQIEYKFKTVEREKKFNSARTLFIELVEKGQQHLKTGQEIEIYNDFPQLHESFEEMAYYLLPLEFPEYRSLRTVVDLMVDTHLENEDYKAIITSLGALKIKNEELQKAEIPEDLTSVEKDVVSDIEAIGKMCGELEGACESTSADSIDTCLKKLEILCDKFEQDYI